MQVPNTGSLTAKAALELLRQGKAPANLTLTEPLIAKGVRIAALPEGLKAASLSLQAAGLTALPDGLEARRIRVQDPMLVRIGRGIRCRSLDVAGTAIETVPDDIAATDRINLADCLRLKSLPGGLSTGSLVLTGCTALTELPAGLDVAFLELSGCTSLRSLPADLKIRGGRLSIRNCPWLTRLPDNLGEISELDVSGCLNLVTLPEGLTVTSWIDIAGSGITVLPESMHDVGLRWRGIPVSHRIVFEPHRLEPAQILSERNAELRRVMMERVGYERLLEVAKAEELDRDRDPGGERRLLRIPLEGDEDVVVVSVQCPSTGHQFILRVPPDMRSCRQAVAWTAGFDNPDDYRPVFES